MENWSINRCGKSGKLINKSSCRKKERNSPISRRSRKKKEKKRKKFNIFFGRKPRRTEQVVKWITKWLNVKSKSISILINSSSFYNLIHQFIRWEFLLIWNNFLKIILIFLNLFYSCITKLYKLFAFFKNFLICLNYYDRNG